MRGRRSRQVWHAVALQYNILQEERHAQHQQLIADIEEGGRRPKHSPVVPSIRDIFKSNCLRQKCADTCPFRRAQIYRRVRLVYSRPASKNKFLPLVASSDAKQRHKSLFNCWRYFITGSENLKTFIRIRDFTFVVERFAKRQKLLFDLI